MPRKSHLPPELKSLIASANAFAKWGKTPDRSAATAAARAAFRNQFLEQVRAEFPDIDDANAELMADSRRRAHYARLAALKAKAAHTRKLAADGGDL